jgi:hypothetical protein
MMMPLVSAAAVPVKDNRWKIYEAVTEFWVNSI